MSIVFTFRARPRMGGGFMVRDYVTNQSKDNNMKKELRYENRSSL